MRRAWKQSLSVAGPARAGPAGGESVEERGNRRKSRRPRGSHEEEARKSPQYRIADGRKQTSPRSTLEVDGLQRLRERVERLIRADRTLMWRSGLFPAGRPTLISCESCS